MLKLWEEFFEVAPEDESAGSKDETIGQASLLDVLDAVVSKTTSFVTCVPMKAAASITCILRAFSRTHSCCRTLQRGLGPHCKIWNPLIRDRCAQSNVFLA
ncbi:hypothetical protein RHSIM_Rhsim04G0073700 [Rhododendron simsii]|uniref:Uncharacterized protein n=1 Tax=Rhododendron simsii TaxID=118357 RepID=A0A834LR58_RHOSS|nr:hypothetical protein RHSIM_Rhsim04G0073700 [Rhododendron simsii]